MLKRVILVLLLVTALSFLLTPQQPAYAACEGDTEKCLNEVQSQISDLQRQLDETRSQKKTLKSQLDTIDAQAKITQLKIDQTNYQIIKLEKEITDLSGRITRLSGTVDSISQVLLTRIVQTYKFGNVTTIDLLFSSHGFTDLLERLKYIEVAQTNDKKVLYELQATKTAYNDQKTDRETRQAQETKLKKDLQSYQKQLEDQKKAKAELLRITQNNEAVFQSRLQAAIAEQNAILAIFSGGGNEVAIGPVSKGSHIGNIIAGRSACSSGSHLHFEVHQGGSLRSPTSLLSNRSVTFDNSPDGTFSFSGSWDWPLADPIIITQGFGSTWWAQHGWYTNPPGHTGIDMVNLSNYSVKAVRDGTLSTGGIACGRGTLRYKKIDHGDGYSSYYLHVI